MELDYSKIYNLDFEDVDRDDHPDYSDAHIVSGYYKEENSELRELTEDEIDELNDDADFVHEKLWDWLY